jgi:hypothetical protein
VGFTGRTIAAKPGPEFPAIFLLPFLGGCHVGEAKQRGSAQREAEGAAGTDNTGESIKLIAVHGAFSEAPKRADSRSLPERFWQAAVGDEKRLLLCYYLLRDVLMHA